MWPVLKCHQICHDQGISVSFCFVWKLFFFPHFLWRGRVCLRVESGSWMLSLTPALHLFMEDNIYIGML